jgi:taste receptor type 2
MGNLGNGFIALMNYTDWVKRRKMSSVNRILTALAISRISLLWSVMISTFISMVYPPFMMTASMLIILNLPWTVTINFSIWFASILSIFYFLKIANFSNSIFLYLKWRVKKVVSVTLLVCLLLLFLNIALVNAKFIWTDGSKRNMSYSSSMNSPAESYRLFLIINTLFLSVPVVVSLTMFLLLIISLWKHHKRMQHTSKRPGDASTKAHIKALQTVIASFLLYSIFFLSIFVQLWSSELLKKKLFISFCEVTGMFSPSFHSYVLILGNSKLRQASLSVLWWLRCRCKGVEILNT